MCVEGSIQTRGLLRKEQETNKTEEWRRLKKLSTELSFRRKNAEYGLNRLQDAYIHITIGSV